MSAPVICNLVSSSSTSFGPPTHTQPHTAIPFSGSTAHFFTTDAPVHNSRATSKAIGIRNPNGTIMYSTHEADIISTVLPPGARHVHIVPALSTHSLLSIGQLCDAGCEVIFNATTVDISHNGNVIMTGSRTPTTKLWHVSLTPHDSPPPSTNNYNYKQYDKGANRRLRPCDIIFPCPLHTGHGTTKWVPHKLPRIVNTIITTSPTTVIRYGQRPFGPGT